MAAKSFVACSSTAGMSFRINIRMQSSFIQKLTINCKVHTNVYDQDVLRIRIALATCCYLRSVLSNLDPFIFIMFNGRALIGS